MHLRRFLFLAILAGLVVSNGRPVLAQTEAEFELAEQVATNPAIADRRKLDQRITMRKIKSGSEDAIEVFYCLSKEELPYALTLGWFTTEEKQGGTIVIDEFGHSVPAPGEKPAGKNFPKGDLKAIKAFDLASSGRLDKALSGFESAVKVAPQSARCHNNYGALLANEEKYSKAKEELETALRLKPDYAIALANRALINYAQGNLNEAISDANKASESGEELLPALMAYGKSSLKLGQADKALVAADKMAALWSQDWRTTCFAGDVLMAQGDLKSARQNYMKALLVAHREPKVLLKLAVVAQQLGSVGEAIKHARSATTSDPDNARAHLMLGLLLEMNRDDKAAQLQFERVLELKPDDQTKDKVYGPLLRVLLANHDIELADKYSKRWLDKNDDNASLHYNRAWVLAQMGTDESRSEAVDEYRRSLELNPELGQAHYNLALLLVKQGHIHQAADQLRQFIEKVPNDPDISRARELLAKIEK